MPSEPYSFKRIAIPAYGPTLLYGIAEGALLPIIALTARDLGASIAVAALMVTVLGIGSLVSNLPASMLTARFGEKWAMVGAAGWAALGMVLAIAAPNVVVFGAAVFMVGMSGAVFYLARQSYLTEAVPIRYRARALSTLGGVMRIGQFIGPFIGAAAIPILGLHGAYWVAMAALVAAGAVALWIPDLAAPGSMPAGVEVNAPTIRSIARSHARIFLTLGTAVLLVGAVRSVRQVVIPLWAEGIGLDPSLTSIIYGASGAIDMLVFYPAGKVMDRFGRGAVSVPCMVIMGVSLCLMPLTSGAVGLLVVSLIMGFGNGIGSGMVMTLGSDNAPSPGRAQFLGIWRQATDAGTMGGPALISLLAAAWSLAAGIVVMGGIAFVAAACLGYWIPKGNSPSGFYLRARAHRRRARAREVSSAVGPRG